MSIRVLAPEVVTKIAAGEVVERPASVVKELVENSIDAGASQIAIEARGGGVELIRVIDNGTGIPSDEVELAFQRHTTSKIRGLDDLDKISSLGFRGEALPSIAAVADVEVLTRAQGEAVGSYLSFKDRKLVHRESRARSQGTTVTVRHLFRHLPARLKFLKSATTENSHIAHLVSQYALGFTEISFSLAIDGRLFLRTPGNGNQRDTVMEVYGVEVAQRMLEVSHNIDMPAVSGLVSPPSLSRSSRGYLSFFVNRRWVNSRLLARAAETAYQGLLMNGRYPIVIVNLSLPPHEIDVNVHPTKREVKFQNDQKIFIAVERAIRKTLLTAQAPEIKVMPPTASQPQSPRLQASMAEELAFLPELPMLRVVGQLANAYILAEDPEGLYLIDQHAAHERILFEKVLSQRSQQRIEVQGLLEPVVIELNPRQEQVLKAKNEVLSQFGFTIEPFGGRSYLIRTVPVLIKETNLKESTEALLEALVNDEATPVWEEKVAQSLACHNAVKAGQVLSMEELRELVRQLELTRQPRTCPHGRPTMLHLSSQRLQKEFGRSG